MNQPAKQPSETASERILNVAIELFAERGYANTFVREIVKRAGVTKPVLYYYFESKEGLFVAILDRAAELQEILLADILKHSGTVMERFGYMCRGFYKGLMEHHHLYRIIHNLVFGPPQGAPPYDVNRYHRRTLEVIKEIYQQAVRHRELRVADPDDVATMVLGLIDFSIHMDFAHAQSADPERAYRLLRLAIQGLHPRTS